ncbi:hypothetical protein SNOG_07142 [Parastagonospora nodorum SN15]|uniref:Uncharacterized protein n=1 Tax=Phaeosphaeria nodorum (strain SN15 / ATCC MYA-4574 / FGSC 10173) TaxID=321614 RepID=Q0UM72_PHANO|nr:hypothetical protein SNOG_07142 [Parastagonospora nodorum SN15]EAT85793.1 hypothetical protein SNOG_07142 [Parastagonospora nodorum SN15]
MTSKCGYSAVHTCDPEFSSPGEPPDVALRTEKSPQLSYTFAKVPTSPKPRHPPIPKSNK